MYIDEIKWPMLIMKSRKRQINKKSENSELRKFTNTWELEADAIKQAEMKKIILKNISGWWEN